jgi:broad specificity phosphatase PhoE
MAAHLIVLRHGNTFEAGEPSRYVGARTDLPLTAFGHTQAVEAGSRLKDRGLTPVAAHTSPLRRTKETAMGALSVFDAPVPLKVDMRLREVDYGPDEDMPDADVKARLGDALNQWHEDATLPPGWSLDIGSVRAVLQQAANDAIKEDAPVLLVTHGGIARFVRDLLPDPSQLARDFSLKLGTGKLAILQYDGDHWTILDWNA